MAEKSTISLLVKIFAYLLLWPIFLLIWTWNKSNWSKRNKWLATAGIGVVFLFALISFSSNDSSKQPEKTAALNSQAEVLPKQENTTSTQTEATQVEELKTQPAEIANDQKEVFRVAHVVDGDTIKLDNGQVLRYIGIDTPETVDPRKPVQCFGKEASDKNRELVEGKEVRLEKDISETDKYGRILRYVYVGDTFINDYLVRQGYAHSYSYPPDIKHQDQFKQAEEEARNNKRGLWADDACKTETTAITAPATPTPSSSSNLGGTVAYSCNCSKTCAQMDCAEAQYQLKSCGCSRRDADKDGVACDADCQ